MTDQTVSVEANSDADDLTREFACAPVMVVRTDERSNISAVTPPFAQMLGLDASEIVGQPLGRFLTPASRSRVEVEMLPELSEHGKCSDVEVTFVDGSQTITQTLAFAHRSQSSDRDAACITIFFQDVSELAKIKTAEKGRERKSRFLAAMSHEFRLPMNVIMGFTQLLQASDLSDVQRKFVSAMDRAGNSLVAMLGDLLDLTRLEAGRMVIHPHHCDIRAIVEDVTLAWETPAKRKGLQLTTTIDTDLPPRLRTDAHRVRQVLGNLVGNAVKFTTQGEIDISVAVEENSGSTCILALEVSDTGNGMSQSTIRTLFQPYQHISPETAGQNKGWGLGLAINQHIAQLMDGRLTVESTLGEGSRFRFEFPTELEADFFDETDIPEDVPTGIRGLKILAADDNLMNREVIQRMLEFLGHEPRVVRNGFEVVRALREQPYDIILMDISMPGVDGIGATEMIRAMSDERSQTPIIAVTAMAGEGNRELYLSIGMDDFLPKPVNLAELQDTINRVLSAQTPALVSGGGTI